MKNIQYAIIGLVIGTAVSSSALDWQKCLEYKFQSVDPRTSWTLQDDGQGTYIKSWSLTNAQPTKADLVAVKVEAETWYSNKVAEAKSDVNAWDNASIDGATMKCVMKALLTCVNKRLPAGDKITMTEFKAEIKAELSK